MFTRLAAACVATLFMIPAFAADLLPRAYNPLPLGSIRPAGWMLDQLRVQANGLSGHLDEFWPDIKDSGWIGGKSEGWERVPYWLDGMVPLAYTLNDDTLKAKLAKYMDYIIAHQMPDGWLGPTSSKGYKPFDPWPTFVVLKAMAQYAEATGDERVVEAMRKNMHRLDALMREKPLFEWGKFRWMDLAWDAHWLYDRSGESWLLDFAQLAKEQGFDWRGHFADFKYTERLTKDFKLETHVVNNAMSIKAGPVWYRQSHDAADRDSVYQALKMLDQYHGQVTGIFAGDEHYAGKSPSQGSELCSVVEWMFSLETAIAMLGDPLLADRLERIAYNALPGTFSPDMWAHQYDQQANQVVCRVSEDRVFASNSANANIFGLEPNYGCCTANMHHGWPKFVSHLWMASPDGGLAAVAYAPCTVDTKIGGKPVKIEVITDYPFSDSIKIAVTADGKMPLRLRIPQWAKDPEVQVAAGQPEKVQPGTFHLINREWKGPTEILLRLPMKAVAERRYNDSVAIVRGPLVYSLKIGQYWKKIGGEEPHADYEVYPTTPWNYGLMVNPDDVESSVTFAADSVSKTAAGKSPFGPDTAPIRATLKGRLVPEWVLEHSAAAVPPKSPLQSIQPVMELTLIPYGCAKLRVTEFPLLAE
jgi:hypothetical protein